jgi:uncharacterized membrane protein YeiH
MATRVAHPVMSRAYLVIDLAATLLFAVEGASAGAASGLDWLGILVVGFCTALVGGVIRDILLGDLPPAAFQSPSRMILAFAGGVIVVIAYSVTREIPGWILVVLDAGALGLFAATGAEKAIAHKSNGLVVVMLGTITAVGGGVVRDVLLNRVPVVLTANIYATAAAAGSLVIWVAVKLKVPPTIAMVLGVVVCVALRLLAVAFDWQLPRVR